ncbi:L-threonylcarbamoyladenylate synthase [Nitratidesulfovibrio sp. D1]|uniref:L-threonylcarbamoyladenylate synthase n=1 Tax=Nitratidesulfovibrio sp. D1 TaxID=3440151 RepID=UPI003EBC75A9
MLNMDDAAALLRTGRVVVFPTETFFGVGCLATHAGAVDEVYRVKRRVHRLALPVIAGHVDQLAQVAARMDPVAEGLARRFWPGPLSVLLPAAPGVPAPLTGGTGRVAVRLTPHPVARELCLLAGGPLVASSANISGRPAVTRVADLDPELTVEVAGVLDLPPAPPGGLPSTLVEVLDGGGGGAAAGLPRLRVLRAGAVPVQALRDAGYAVE